MRWLSLVPFWFAVLFCGVDRVAVCFFLRDLDPALYMIPYSSYVVML